MSWELLLVLGVPLALLGVLSLSAWVERRILSPQSLIVRAARGHSDPDIAERLVTVETERLLRHAEEDDEEFARRRQPSPSAA